MRAATRLATLIVSQGGLFFPMLENIMTSHEDSERPGIFLNLFPHPLSRLFVTLLWKINAEQDGDAVVLSNVWLRRFACLDNKSLLRYRQYLNNNGVILAVPLGSGREHLYRICNPRTGLPLSDETNVEIVDRLRNPERIREVARTRIMRRYRKQPAQEAPTAATEPVPIRSSWDEWAMTP
jgi:hypothetical protein